MKKIIRLTEQDLARIVRRVIKEVNDGDPEQVIIDCIKENTTLKELSTIPDSCIKLFKDKDMTQVGACKNDMGPENYELIKTKTMPITICVGKKMLGGGGISFPGI
jgi:ethanolamine ammonia-lyase small subunit